LSIKVLQAELKLHEAALMGATLELMVQEDQMVVKKNDYIKLGGFLLPKTQLLPNEF
jgi:hypothetical protein